MATPKSNHYILDDLAGKEKTLYFEQFLKQSLSKIYVLNDSAAIFDSSS